MNYTAGSIDMNAVCAAPSLDKTIVPPLPEQLGYVRDVLGQTMDLSNRLANYVMGRGIPYENREDDNLTAYLKWMVGTLQMLNDNLRAINEVVR